VPLLQRLSWIVLAVAVAVAVPCDASAHRRGGHRGSPHSSVVHGNVSHSHARGHSPVLHASSSGIRRDRHGRIQRSEIAKRSFLKQHGLQRVPRGMQVDHRVPLCAGGADSPSNMQLIPTSQHRAKTRGDVRACRRR
jgi:hypothetical protein